MLKPVFILLCAVGYIGHIHLTGGVQMFDIYVVVEEDSKEDVFQELKEKYNEVVEQSFFLPNKSLIVARSKRKISGLRSKRFQSAEEELTEDIYSFRQKPHVILSSKVELLERHVRNFRTSDTDWSKMWQMDETLSPSMKVVDAWKCGYNGSGIIVSVVDDGLETNHSDLGANVRVNGHYDFVDNDSDPNPPLNSKHGTQVAGLIAAERDNNNCIVGVAYSSTLIGIRLIYGDYTTDISEAYAIAHGHNITDISSNSWNPPDSYGYNGPGPLTVKAFELGITEGRGGKGVIYIWAAGNGGITDNCNADGYVNSIYTVAISSCDSMRQPASYSEVCAPALAITYSGDDQKYMVSTSNPNRCSGGIEGTSFSAPQAAGMVALALQANHNLTWRDVQHLIVKTAKYQNLTEAPAYGFTLNGAGNYVGQMFGYGLMDAEAMVNYSKTWKPVPDQKNCTDIKSTLYWVLNSTLATKSDYLTVEERTCPINYLEHVQVHTIFQSSERAYVELELISPAGTRSKLMTQRRYDKGFSRQQEWTFMSVQFWGENPMGNWTFSITIPSNQTGNLTSWQLILYGTSVDPLPDINACDESPCKNGGHCTSDSKYDIFNCTCAPGYTGKTCETEINECENKPCKGNATCNDLVNAYICTCPDGYGYNYTDDVNQCQDINECASSPCAGNSTCENRQGDYLCACPIGYVYNDTARNCTDWDECNQSRCSEDHECINTIGSYTCNCTLIQGCNNSAAPVPSMPPGTSEPSFVVIIVVVLTVLLLVAVVPVIKICAEVKKKQNKVSCSRRQSFDGDVIMKNKVFLSSSKRYAQSS